MGVLICVCVCVCVCGEVRTVVDCRRFSAFLFLLLTDRYEMTGHGDGASIFSGGRAEIGPEEDDGAGQKAQERAHGGETRRNFAVRDEGCC
jgi:hypothetical protein